MTATALSIGLSFDPPPDPPVGLRVVRVEFDDVRAHTCDVRRWAVQQPGGIARAHAFLLHDAISLAVDTAMRRCGLDHARIEIIAAGGEREPSEWVCTLDRKSLEWTDWTLQD